MMFHGAPNRDRISSEQAIKFLKRLKWFDWNNRKSRSDAWAAFKVLGIYERFMLLAREYKIKGVGIIQSRKRAGLDAAEEWRLAQLARGTRNFLIKELEPFVLPDDGEDEQTVITWLLSRVENDNAPTAKNVAWVSANLPPLVGNERMPINWNKIDPDTVPSKEAINMLTFAYNNEDAYRSKYDAKRMPTQQASEGKKAFTGGSTPASELLERLRKRKADAGL
jgi:hypothetical protein